ncbi:PBP1A family penicillin-binding protein [Vibrio sp. SS-MA-C1-2]|uniref:penicillin-binding protein 1A n=1 Tax=Vibrio sp. SS-MA-C1-2 TaxID=2908646 RepID=UPI001F21014F|nr:PBP1A family penicillin-binding protein [Vibrio sp. SS-MA-C1-2]UJF19226.1 PBP1A family penicillin-binding protein [Vibrio sp. SS-MA-C1-2]
MKFIKRFIIFTIICAILGVGSIIGLYFYLKPSLPTAVDIEQLRNDEMHTPMQIYTKDGVLISQFGEKRRIPLSLNKIPLEMQHAFIATEDSRFYEHIGIDPIGIIRAIYVAGTSGHVKQGASTITQQLARNYFLTNERTLTRKIKEVFIALHIEQVLSKNEILELYLNKIYLGYRAYGVGAAAQVYFGKDVDQLTLSEMAVIAGLPKAPSTMNPLYSLKRATERRNVVLFRLLDEKYITQAQYDQAHNEAIVASYHETEIKLQAPYVAELARQWAIDNYGEAAYTSGKNIYTTIDSKLQAAAQKAAVENLLSYDMRHGFRGEVSRVWEAKDKPFSQEDIIEFLGKQPSYGELKPAVVVAEDPKEKSATAIIKDGNKITIPWDGLKWARRYITDKKQGPAPKTVAEIIEPGDQIWVREVNGHWQLSQVPNANTAFVALNPENGAVDALVGGFNFTHNKFNRATQSIRQVGSSIKPFLYSAALDQGMTLATLINDAPINKVYKSEGTTWRPKNSPPKYNGPTRIRIGLAQSKNVMAVRTLEQVGIQNAIDYLTRFGFKKDELPKALSLALGAGSLTPLEVARGFAAFKNGGYLVEPFYIDHITDANHQEVYKANPTVICQTDCQQIEQDYLDKYGKIDGDQRGIEDKAEIDTEVKTFNETDLSTQAPNSQVANTDDLTATEQQPRYAPRIISSQNAFLVREMMESNIWGGGNWRAGTGWNGTGWRAQVLKRRDIGGKTGTTNDSKDTWYNGFAPHLVATAWVGFDGHKALGRSSYNNNLDKHQIYGGESGAKTSEPAWIDFMKVALKDVPAEKKHLPANIVRVRIDRATGKLTEASDSTSRFEYFIKGTEPTEYVTKDLGSSNVFESDDGEIEELF